MLTNATVMQSQIKLQQALKVSLDEMRMQMLGVHGRRGNHTAHTTAAWYAQLALLPLAGGVGCDVFVATSRPFGPLLDLRLQRCLFVLHGDSSHRVRRRNPRSDGHAALSAV